MFSRSSVRPSARPPIHPSAFCFRSLTRIDFDGFSTRFAYICISGVNGLGLFMGRFVKFLEGVAALAYRQHVVSAKYFENELKDLDEISYIK